MVTDLLNKGHTARKVAKQAHVSFTDIMRIRAKLTDNSTRDRDKKEKKPMSLPSQAFNLFLEDKSLVDVTIALDVPSEQVLKFHKDCLNLQQTSKFVSILSRHRDSIPSFLAWFEHIEKRGVKPEDFTVALKCAKDLQTLQKEKENLENELESLYSERETFIAGMASLQKLYR